MAKYKIEHVNQPGRYAKDVNGKDRVFNSKDSIPAGVDKDKNWKVVEVSAKKEPPTKTDVKDGEPKK